MRSKVLPWMACALVALVFIPALASGDPHWNDRVEVDGAFETYDNGFREVGQPVLDNTVNIAVGERVTWRSPLEGDPPNQGVHNVAFDETSPKPAECNQTVQAPGGDPPDTDGTEPMPNTVQPVGWEGYCRFTAAGVYTFFCRPTAAWRAR